MRFTLLGTGTSQGVPVIGCDCKVCKSSDARDQRLRAAALISVGEHHILIDAGPDFRQQMLRNDIQQLEAILLTHEHNDHVIGIDDVRPFNFKSGKAMPVYTLERVANDVRKRFEYVFAEPIPGLPRLELLHIDADTCIHIQGIPIQSIGVMHGYLPILGFRIGNLAYLTDVKTLLPAEKAKLAGVKYLVINALQHTPHPTHMNLEECLQLIAQLMPEQTWLTHVSHLMGLSEEVNASLPPNVMLAYDGLEIEFSL